MNFYPRSMVSVIYPFFAHYRAGVFRELTNSDRHDFLFAGGVKGPVGHGIKCWEIPEGTKFIPTSHCLLLGRFIFQSGVIALALRPGSHTMIFLGEAYNISTWFAAALARLTGKRVYFWTHGWTERDRGIKRHIRVAFYRLAHGLLLYGHHAKQIGIEFGFKKERMHVIFNSLDYTVQVAARESVKEEELLGIRETLFPAEPMRPMLICTGRLIPMRQIEMLFDAMEIMQKDEFPVNLLLIGDGPEKTALESQAMRSRLSVNFYGPCYDEGILAKLFMSSDILVMPGRIGLSAIHSLAYGTPVIVHDDPNDQGPEWESIIPGFNGAHFAHGDSKDLARCIRGWIGTVRDRQVIRNRSYDVVERFYNPTNQAALIERALDGKMADDSAWQEYCGKGSDPGL